jgi:hypothetical protein
MGGEPVIGEGKRPRYVSLTSCPHRVGNAVHQVYGALGVRYWSGTPGESPIYSGSALFWEPIRLEDKTQFEAQIRGALKQEVVRQVAEQTGLHLAADALNTLEWLVIWEADLDTIMRVRAFEQGFSRALQGKRARDLKVQDMSRLARQLGMVPERPQEGTAGDTRVRQEGTEDRTKAP